MWPCTVASIHQPLRHQPPIHQQALGGVQPANYFAHTSLWMSPPGIKFIRLQGLQLTCHLPTDTRSSSS